MEKPYKLGLIVGRFQTLHLGHEDMLKTAFALCERVGILIGSSQESGTAKNPFTYEMREKFLRSVFGDAPEIYPLPDIGVGNNGKWGEYVLENAQRDFGRLPDLAISGKEERRASWLDCEKGYAIAELRVPKTIDISASRMREFFLLDDRQSFEKYTSASLHPYYEIMREAVAASKDNTDTRSI